jgi:hypothetical protein
MFKAMSAYWVGGSSPPARGRDHPAFFASNSRGTCVVAQGQALLHLELKFLATPATETKDEAKDENKYERK